MPRKRICLTGGGTAGHVTPNFALLPLLRQHQYDIFYVGSGGIEKGLVQAQNIPFYQIPAGKLRRYLSIKNLFDVFKVAAGVVAAFFIFLRKRPTVVFSKGGFVSVPVAVAAWFLRIPVVSHESDMTPGLATRIVARFAKQILYTFPETGRYLPRSARNVGTPIRSELFEGDEQRAREFCGFSENDLPTLLVMGGSQGATRINEALLACLPDLVEHYQVIHLTGRGKKLSFSHPRYHGVEYVQEELKDLLALADLVISRAGANSIFELLALRKPMLLIPLEVGSRGDQVMNAGSFAEKGWAQVLEETSMTPELLHKAIDRAFSERDQIRLQQETFAASSSAEHILAILDDIAGTP